MKQPPHPGHSSDQLPNVKKVFPDIFLTSCLTQFGQVTTCAFIIAIQGK